MTRWTAVSVSGAHVSSIQTLCQPYDFEAYARGFPVITFKTTVAERVVTHWETSRVIITKARQTSTFGENP